MDTFAILKLASQLLKIARPEGYMKEYMANRYKAKRQEVVDLLGGKCVMCGSPNGPFDFDHIDKSKKTMRANNFHSFNKEKLEEELKNIQLLCKECHKQKTREAWDYHVPKPSHGKVWSYKHYKCRCPECTQAYKEYLAKYKKPVIEEVIIDLV